MYYIICEGEENKSEYKFVKARYCYAKDKKNPIHIFISPAE